MADRIVVVSTCKDAPEQALKCIQSTSQQIEPNTHVFIDASHFETASKLYRATQTPIKQVERDRKGSDFKFVYGYDRMIAHNLYCAIDIYCQPSDIVVWLDGDDWLVHPRALKYVRLAYEREETWATYGSFKFGDGTPGWASEYPGSVVATGSCRHDIWRATHLKTFRSGLFHQIKESDLHVDGDVTKPWLNHAVDLAIMFPILEMARERAKFLDDVLCVYSREGTPEGSKLGSPTWNTALEIRARKPYARLNERSW